MVEQCRESVGLHRQFRNVLCRDKNVIMLALDNIGCFVMYVGEERENRPLSHEEWV
jgi:hypothetical protein